jgi:transposase-like protein
LRARTPRSSCRTCSGTPAASVTRLTFRGAERLLCPGGHEPKHWPKLRSTNPLERVNREIGRRSDVVGIFPNDTSAIRLAGALLIEQNDEWIVCRYLSEESMRPILCAGTDREDSPSPISEEVDRLAA